MMRFQWALDSEAERDTDILEVEADMSARLLAISRLLSVE